ncbi:MAG: hypothetical protein AMJ54_00080 [Deltaproteobacteria bacterium SG8_13]|nr:MAG: hypothetical protein AMJ54_00080 [Deltaproteobacteria bacterium SG8_13]
MVGSFLRFQLKSSLLVLCTVAMIAAVGLARGELTVAYFVRALGWSGLACILTGCLSMLGSFASRGSFEVQFSRSAGAEGLEGRSDRDVRDMLGSFYYLVLFAWTGGLQLLLSMLVHHRAG